MGQHSENVPDALARSARGDDENWKLRTAELLAGLRVVLVQRIEPTTTGTRIGLQEWLVMTDEARKACLAQLDKATTWLQFRALLEEVLDQHGHTFEASAQNLFKQGIVPKKTADDLAKLQNHRRQEKSLKN